MDPNAGAFDFAMATLSHWRASEKVALLRKDMPADLNHALLSS